MDKTAVSQRRELIGYKAKKMILFLDSNYNAFFTILI